MNKKKSFRKLTGLLMIVLLLSGCMKMQELYDPNARLSQLPPIDEYFDFNTTDEVSLSVNYDLKGRPLLLELYGENPIVKNEEGTVRTKRQDISPLFMTYTDMTGKYEGKITLPTYITTVYLYSREMGLPECVEREIIDNAIEFDYSAATTRSLPATRAYNFTGGGDYPYFLEGNIYSLSKWGDEGLYTAPAGYIEETEPPIPIPIWDDDGVTSLEEELGSFTGRLKNILWNKDNEKTEGLDNSTLIGGVEQTNFYLKVETEVTFMFLHERAGYRNTFGYYYYKGSGERDVSGLRKFVLFPNVSIQADDPYDKMQYNQSARKNEYIAKAPLRLGDKVKLKFYGEDGTGKAEDKFPAGYTIGWFLIPNGFRNTNTTSTGGWGWGGGTTANDKNQLQNVGDMLTSNDPDAARKFVSIYDEKLRGVVVGCEDGPDKSFEDMLFCVFTKDMDAIIDPKNPGRPYIDKDNTGDILPADATLITRGTLAFEDIWPDGGDYDMNDVALEYTHSTTFNYKNEVVRIEDFFRPTNDGATIDNAFAYQVGAGQIGELVEKPNETFVETETNSIIVYPNNREAIRTGKTYNIVRDFSNLTVLKDDLEPYNPYIILRYLQPDHKTRTEVHLPKRKATSLAEQKLLYTENDAFFIDIEGKYPFAIDIPIHNYRVPTESTRIDAETEYPDFKAWADSKGATNKDWYLNYAGNK